MTLNSYCKKKKKKVGAGVCNGLAERDFWVAQYLECIKNSLKSLKKPAASWAKDFTQKEIQTAHIYVKRCLSSLVIRDTKNHPPV